MAAQSRTGAANANLREVANACLIAAPDDPLSCWDGFIRSRFVYRREYREVIRTVAHSIENLMVRGRIEGDCDCVSVFLGAGALALGYPVRFVAIRTDEKNPEFDHVFTEVMDGGRWRRFDPTVKPSTVEAEIFFDSMGVQL